MKLYRLLALLVVVSCLVLAIASCGGESGEGDTADPAGATDNETEKATADPEEMKGKLSIFLEGEYVCNVICPEKATEVEQDIYKKIRERLKTVTGKLPPLASDFVAFDGTGVSREEPAILIGRTNYEESKQVYADLAYGESRIEMVGNKLVIAFSAETDANYIYLKFLGLTNRFSSVYFGIDETTKISVFANDYLATLPRYPSDNSSVINGEDESFLACVPDATLEGFDEYCKTLAASGYTQTDRKVIDNNVFVTLMNDTHYLYVYYTAYNNAIKLAGGPLSLYAASDNSSELEETYTPYIASIPQPNNGQGYIFRLPDGRFIIHDGGYSGADRVYKTLRELEEGDITIAAWFISHPHGDHFPAFIDFIRDHAADESITIEMVAFNYSGAEVYDLSDSAGKENQSSQVEKLYNSIATYLPDTAIVKVHTGQTLNFGSVSVEVIYTVEDILPRILPNVNDSSLVLRFNFDGQSLLMLADTCYDSAPIMCEMWGDYLKSDVMQMAHHGVWPAQPDIYHHIQAETVLFPATHDNMKNDLFDNRWGATTQAALQYAKDIFISGDSVQIIELPHAIENNKEETMEYVKNYQGG